MRLDGRGRARSLGEEAHEAAGQDQSAEDARATARQVDPVDYCGCILLFLLLFTGAGAVRQPPPGGEVRGKSDALLWFRRRHLRRKVGLRRGENSSRSVSFGLTVSCAGA